METHRFIALDIADEMAELVLDLLDSVPGKLAHVADHCGRAACSAPNNLAEGAGRCGRDRLAPVIPARSSGLSRAASRLGGVRLTRVVVGPSNRHDAGGRVVTAVRGTGEWVPGVRPARALAAWIMARGRPGSSLGLRLLRGV